METDTAPSTPSTVQSNTATAANALAQQLAEVRRMYAEKRKSTMTGKSHISATTQSIQTKPSTHPLPLANVHTIDPPAAVPSMTAPIRHVQQPSASIRTTAPISAPIVTAPTTVAPARNVPVSSQPSISVTHPSPRSSVRAIQWDCVSCGAKSNPSDTNHCEVCCAIRPASTHPPPSALPPSQPPASPVRTNTQTGDGTTPKRVIKCGRCGAEGHMRTNRSCPMYDEEEERQRQAIIRPNSTGTAVQGLTARANAALPPLPPTNISMPTTPARSVTANTQQSPVRTSSVPTSVPRPTTGSMARTVSAPSTVTTRPPIVPAPLSIDESASLPSTPRQPTTPARSHKSNKPHSSRKSFPELSGPTPLPPATIAAMQHLDVPVPPPVSRPVAIPVQAQNQPAANDENSQQQIALLQQQILLMSQQIAALQRQNK